MNKKSLKKNILLMLLNHLSVLEELPTALWSIALVLEKEIKKELTSLSLQQLRPIKFQFFL